MSEPTGYDTVSEAISDLSRRGYSSSFRLDTEGDRLICSDSSRSLYSEDFKIDAVYRFEGDTDPGDEMIVFAISSDKENLKGVVVNAYGTYADTDSSRIVQHLRNRL